MFMSFNVFVMCESKNHMCIYVFVHCRELDDEVSANLEDDVRRSDS